MPNLRSGRKRRRLHPRQYARAHPASGPRLRGRRGRWAARVSSARVRRRLTGRAWANTIRRRGVPRSQKFWRKRVRSLRQKGPGPAHTSATFYKENVLRLESSTNGDRTTNRWYHRIYTPDLGDWHDRDVNPYILKYNQFKVTKMALRIRPIFKTGIGGARATLGTADKFHPSAGTSVTYELPLHNGVEIYSRSLKSRMCSVPKGPQAARRLRSYKRRYLRGRYGVRHAFKPTIFKIGTEWNGAEAAATAGDKWTAPVHDQWLSVLDDFNTPFFGLCIGIAIRGLAPKGHLRFRMQWSVTVSFRERVADPYADDPSSYSDVVIQDETEPGDTVGLAHGESTLQQLDEVGAADLAEARADAGY